MPAMPSELRSATLRGLPAEILRHMDRVHQLAARSSNIRDLVALDSVFSFIAEQQLRIADLEAESDA